MIEKYQQHIPVVPPAPIHPYSAIVTLLMDNVVGALEVADPFLLVVSCVGLGLLTTFVVTTIQQQTAHDSFGDAIGKGLLMGVIAGIPFSVAGTAVGVALIGWSGLNSLLNAPAEK
jgi:Na+-driven multidrug efflux pump